MTSAVISRGWAKALVAGFVLVLMSGCEHVRPWERGKLAHPTMTGLDDGPAAGHVYAVQEGAMGGSANAESGCGCN